MLSYRAVCHELFSKLHAEASYEIQRPLVDRGKHEFEQVEIQAIIGSCLQGVRLAIRELEAMKAILDEALLSGDYSACEIVAIEMDGDVSVATSGTITPDIDLANNRLQTLHDTSTPAQWMSIAVDSTPSGLVVVFLWLRSDRHPRQFVDSILAQSSGKIPQLLVQLLFFYVENSYFSKAWWSGQGGNEQRHLRALAVEPHSYYAPRTLKPGSFVPWTINDVFRFERSKP